MSGKKITAPLVKQKDSLHMSLAEELNSQNLLLYESYLTRRFSTLLFKVIRFHLYYAKYIVDSQKATCGI